MLMIWATCLRIASPPTTDAHDAVPFAGIYGTGPQLMLMMWATLLALCKPAQLMLMMLSRLLVSTAQGRS